MTSKRRYVRGLLAAIAAGSLVLSLGAAPGHALSPVPPKLKLIAADSEITLYRYGKYPIPLSAGVFMESLGGPWELRVHRDDYLSPIELDWWIEGGADIRTLDPALLDGWRGLKDFFHIRVKNVASGIVKMNADTMFCPSSYDRSRVNDNGPAVPAYPSYGCYGMPLTLGTVWGVDDGWAVSAIDPYGYYYYGGAPFLDVADGTFTAKFQVNPDYEGAFEMTEADSTVTVTIHVVTDPHCTWPCYGRDGALIVSDEDATARDDGRAVLTGVPETTDPDPATEPDLISLPAWSIYADHRKKGDFLQFAANIWNRGPGGLVVEGFRRPDEDVMDAFQYFYSGDTAVAKANVGSFEFDARPGHNHWHFQQFAAYTLLDASMSPVVPSTKEAFCLAPTDPIDLTVEGAQWSPYEIGLGTQCGYSGSIWVREYLDTGWGDTYYQSIAGQSFDITDLPNGRYYIQVEANPTGLLYEGDTSNNVSVREVRLKGKEGHRWVVVPPWNGIDTEGCYYYYYC